MKIKEEPSSEIKYDIKTEYGWLDCTYYPDRALEQFVNTFSRHVDPDTDAKIIR